MAANLEPKQEAPWTLGRLRDWTVQFLQEKGCEFPRLDAEVLLAHILGCKRIDLYVRNEELATPDARSRYKELIRKRIEGCPVAYLVGRKEFFSLELEVGPAVLIPRPDTETVVTACLELAKPSPAPAVVDVGTGSGAIAIAIAKNHAGAALTAIDFSPEALAVAQRNAVKHGLTGRVRFLQGDLLAPLAAEERFDFMLSNPPYIAREDWEKLPIGVRQYEPRLALDGGPGGYQVITRLLERAGDHLHPGGYLILEIGAPQEQTVRTLVQALPAFTLEPTIHDHGRLPRVVRARYTP
jgi:release factor glutamine methyltransferase